MARRNPTYVAIIGSANAARNDEGPEAYRYQPRLKHDDDVMDACEQIGAALARQDDRIVVDPSDTTSTDLEAGNVRVGTQQSAYLGAVAGGITGLFCLISQLSSSASTSLTSLTAREHHTFAPFSVAIGFSAGIALDNVFQRLVDAGAASADDA